MFNAGKSKSRTSMTRYYSKLFYLTLVIFSVVLETSGKECNSNDLCSCTFDDGSMVDITSLGNTDNTPRFADVKGSDLNLYSYNPCKPFSEASCSTDAAACVLDPTKSQSVQIGDSSKAVFKYDDESTDVVVGYTSGTITDLRVTQVLLVCDQTACSPEFSAQGEQTGGVFQFTVKTVCACPGGCSASGPKSCGSSAGAGGISGGSILLIAFAIVVVIYFVAGVVVQKFVRKKGGKEIVPNSNIWFSIPSYIKTGTYFVLGLCIPRFRNVNFEAI